MVTKFIIYYNLIPKVLILIILSMSLRFASPNLEWKRKIKKENMFGYTVLPNMYFIQTKKNTYFIPTK